ncbi:MAG: hypothetical protein Q9180_007075, partial [Flavoplaca navasiana]
TPQSQPLSSHPQVSTGPATPVISISPLFVKLIGSKTGNVKLGGPDGLGPTAAAQILTLSLLVPNTPTRSASIYAVANPFGVANSALASSVSMAKLTPGQTRGARAGRERKMSFMMPRVSSLMMESRAMKRRSAGKGARDL